MKSIFKIELEVSPMKGSQLPPESIGAFVSVFVGATDIKIAIDLAESSLFEDRYRPVKTSAAFELDSDDIDNEDIEEDYPTKSDLMDILTSGEVLYGPFMCFGNEDDG